MLPPTARAFLCAALAFTASLPAAPAPSADPDVAALRSALIPKREVAADQFLKANPTFDGREVVIAVFDTGVDPAAAGLSVTSTGQRKLVDILDASGSGDVPTTVKRKPGADGKLAGLSGRSLVLPAGVTNPSGEYRLGLKPASELFYGDVLKRLNDRRAAARAAAASLRQAERDRGADAAKLKSAKAKAADDRSRPERDLLARTAALAALEEGKAGEEPGAVFDCVVWQDGKDWRVLVDTDEDGDLADEKILRPFGVAGEYASFGEITFTTFGVQVYENGDLLSVVTVSGNHGTHVAAIAAAHFPSERSRDGIAPGARILSIKIGDIRTGGSSYGLSETRAIALSARYKVDLMNASWGGRSFLQDGRNRSSRLYDSLIERFDILAVMSAGNNGPALGTAGNAGAEASRVLGVGAYMSTEMGRVLYQTLAASPDSAQGFTSRGPTKDGDVGVDLMAPGAAFASTSAEGLRGAEMMNGTSMASPSAVGVAALVLSAAKQQKLDASPARLRAALILGASPLPQEDELTRGSGLINAPGGWAKLQALQGQPAFGAYYDLEVDGGTFTAKGRGLLLRESIENPRRRFTARVIPYWPESVPPAARFAFESDVVLKPSVPWITAPDFVHVANGPRTLSLIVDVPPVPAGQLGSLYVARVDARLAGKPELGPVFSIPVTVIQPAPASAFKDHKLETAVDLKPAQTKRLFVAAPDGATRLRITVQHRAPDALVRRFVVQALAFAAQTHIAAFETDQNLTLEPGEERTFDLRIRPGAVAEIALAMLFSAVGDATLATKLEWIGPGLGSAPVVMPANTPWTSVDLDPFADRDVKVEAKLDRAVHVFLPETTSNLKMDEHAEFPASALTPGPARPTVLRQRFTLEFKESVSVHVLANEDYDLSDAVGGGRVTLVHESGEKLFDSLGSNSSAPGRAAVKLPKGKTIAVREFVAAEPELLASLATLPLRLAEPLKTVRPVPVRANLRDRFFGKDTTELKLAAGRQEVIFLQDKAVEDLAKHEPKPAHFLGDIQIKDTENRELARQPLVYLGGTAPSKVTNVAPKAKPVKDDRSDVEKLADSLYDSRLAFVREHRGTTDAAVLARRTEVLAALRAERPADAATAFEAALDAALAAKLAGDTWPKAKPAAPAKTDDTKPKTDDDEKPAEKTAAVSAETAAPVVALLDEARKLADPDAVARYFGAPPAIAAADAAAKPALEREKKKFTAQRDTLAKIERLRTDVLRATAQWDAAWKAFAEIKRWEPETGDKQTKAIEAAMLEQAGHLGLALDALNARIKDDPSDKKLRIQRAALYDQLGWKDQAAKERLRLAILAHQKKTADSW
ncbi:MAG: hypothetical protein B9S34_00015 [Opitutia bacterium Tous-C1TDCM]|nr:MAG: hypothetical protein B9S34_00015 [Opitutae bacterium Tous-C1TDCM]